MLTPFSYPGGVTRETCTAILPQRDAAQHIWSELDQEWTPRMAENAPLASYPCLVGVLEAGVLAIVTGVYEIRNVLW